MKIKIINPNTSEKMTRDIEKAALTVAGPETIIEVVNVEEGPDSIECYTDEYIAIPGVMKEIIKGEKSDVDVFIIACFGDPGLQAARELTDKPVLGIAESAMKLATIISPYFSVVSVLDRSRKMTEDLVEEYGMSKFCKSIRTTGLAVLDFSQDPERGLSALREQAHLAIENDGAECIVLGCAGFVSFTKDLQEELGVPVLDGVLPAVKFGEAIAGLNVKTSKSLTWGRPEEKGYCGYSFL